MRTNIDIDDALLDAAMTATGIGDKKRPPSTGPCEVSLRGTAGKCDRRSRRDRLGKRPRRDTSRPAGRSVIVVDRARWSSVSASGPPQPTCDQAAGG
ncbi:type II toxin-antitoxin system VapB family antitoxin [Rhizobium leguminosarum]|uniref:type II toxin-antitoxin system VapB family antitoxin n=1 Tax=Rhizobium leguminosarum TaxID=384 RepID=UPI0028F41E4A|nr:type II toxin-antitoxin system VapB family antitoxin [Rhizobium leguminosarum]